MTTPQFAVDPKDSIARSRKAVTDAGLPVVLDTLVKLYAATFSDDLRGLMTAAALLVNDDDSTPPRAVIRAFQAAVNVTMDDAILVCEGLFR